MAFSVERLAESEIDSLFQFRERVHPDKPKRRNRDRWRWLYQLNPATGEQLPVWVLKTQDRIVGSIGAIPCRVRIGQELVTAYFGADFFVEGAFLGFPALRLLKTMLSHCPILVSINFSESVRKLLLEMGSVDLSDELYLASTSLSTNGDASLSFIIKQCLRSGAHFAAAASGYKVEILDRMPDDYEELWRSISARRETGIEKTRGYLHWRYEQCPTVEYQFICCCRHGRLCALAVVAIHQRAAGEGTIGTIFDLLVTDGNRFAVMVAVGACLKYFVERGCIACQMHWNAGWARPILRGLGFCFSKSDLAGLLVLVKKGVEQFKPMQQPAAWSIALGDTDRY